MKKRFRISLLKQGEQKIKKIVLLGPKAIGKTYLLNKLRDNVDGDTISTIGVDCVVTTHKDQKFMFEELCGDKRFTFLAEPFLKTADAAIIMIDESTKESELQFWLALYNTYAFGKPVLWFLKTDTQLLVTTNIEDIHHCQILTKVSYANFLNAIDLIFPPPPKKSVFFRAKPNKPSFINKQEVFNIIKKYVSNNKEDEVAKQIYLKLQRGKYHCASDVLDDFYSYEWHHQHPLANLIQKVLPAVEMVEMSKAPG